MSKPQTAIQVFNAKNTYMNEYYPEVTASELYRDIFAPELLEKKGDMSYRASNPIFTYKESKTSDDGSKKTYFRNEIVFADAFDESLRKVAKNDCALCSMITYSGRNKTAKNAYKCYGFIIDLDGVGMLELESFWGWVEHLRYIPRPTYLINSGHGLHVYYVFENPVPLYPHVVQYLQSLKQGLTRCVWNRETSNYKPYERQFQGIYQSFRMVGSRSKLGKGTSKNKYLVRGWKTGGRYSFEELNKYVSEEYRVPGEKDYASWEWTTENHYTLEECKNMFPEWYERRIIKNEPPNQWICHKGLYEWWLNVIQVKGNAVDGNRFHCISMLYVYAVKCMIPKEIVDIDAYGLIEQFDELTSRTDNNFTKADVDAASEFYDTKYASISINHIKLITKIDIKKNKRNGRKQKQHLYLARQRKKDLKFLGEQINEGRPKGSNKSKIVEEWQKNHSDGRKADCIRDTGLSKPTVLKWWKP